jgi:hypothetical protein
MILNKKELDERIELMGILGISSAYQQYFIESANDEAYKGVIELIDKVSSKAFAIGVASSGDLKAAIEDHLDVRRELIEKIKKLDGIGNE